MSDTQTAGEQNNQTQQQTQQQTEDKSTQDRNWRQLEEKATTNEANANKWRKKALETAATAAGYDITKGVTQSLIEKFDGDGVSPDLFKTFAEGEGLTPHSALTKQQEEQEVVETLDTTNNNQQQVQQTLQTQQPQKKTVKEQIAEAQKNNDLGGALSAALGEDVMKHFDVPLTPQ